MNAKEFDELFEETVARRLENEGFSREGKSLYMVDGVCQFGWVRGGGRLSQAGTLAHVIVFRHSFLRGKSGALHTDAPHATGDYPWTLSGENLVGSTPISQHRTFTEGKYVGWQQREQAFQLAKSDRRHVSIQTGE